MARTAGHRRHPDSGTPTCRRRPLPRPRIQLATRTAGPPRPLHARWPPQPEQRPDLSPGEFRTDAPRFPNPHSRPAPPTRNHPQHDHAHERDPATILFPAKRNAVGRATILEEEIRKGREGWGVVDAGSVAQLKRFICQRLWLQRILAPEERHNLAQGEALGTEAG